VPINEGQEQLIEESISELSSLTESGIPEMSANSTEELNQLIESLKNRTLGDKNASIMEAEVRLLLKQLEQLELQIYYETKSTASTRTQPSVADPREFNQQTDDYFRRLSDDPIATADGKLLILGSMPGKASFEAQQYYAHPRNGFWPIMQTIFGGCIDTYTDKLALLQHNRIVLWDTVRHCTRPGSLDSSIRSESVVCNDFVTLFKTIPTIDTIAFNGKAAEKWFRKLASPTNEPDLHIDKFTLVSLPSSSPAMASLKLNEKAAIWHDALCGEKQISDTA